MHGFGFHIQKPIFASIVSISKNRKRASNLTFGYPTGETQLAEHTHYECARTSQQLS